MKEEKISVTSGKKKATVRKETVAVSATKPKIVRKNQNTLPPLLLSQPYHEVEVCRGREVSEAKVTMGPFFDNRADTKERYLHANGFCEYWHPPECQFYKNETGCKAGDKCLFPHYKVDEQPNKKPKKSNIPKRRESDDKSAVAIVKSVSHLGCVSQDSDALVSQDRKSRGHPMQKVLEPIQRVRCTKSMLRHASIREKKGPSLGKIQGVSPHWGVMVTQAPIWGNRAWETKFLFHAPVSLDWGIFSYSVVHFS